MAGTMPRTCVECGHVAHGTATADKSPLDRRALCERCDATRHLVDVGRYQARITKQPAPGACRTRA